jgi:tetratricopeptide (TPR) repeat protein
VLVGVVGSLAFVTSRAPQPNVPAAAALPPAPRAAATAAAVERGSELRDSANVEAENGTGRRSEEAPSPVTSSSGAPSCRQLLGEDFVERDDPKAAQRETRIANRKLVVGDVPEAQAAYCRAFLLDRSNVDRHINLGRLFLVRRDWEKAAEFGQSALKLDPNSARALGVVGDAWAALSRTDEARSAWLAAENKTTASRRELDLIARRNMALAKRVERLQDFSLAERLYRRVLLLQPEHAGATKGLASCLARAGDHAAAETWAYRADMLKLRKKRAK